MRLLRSPSVLGGEVHHLTKEEMGQVVEGLRALRALAPEAPVEGPLDVHPALVAQGASGPYGTALRELVLGYIGEQTLARVTFFLRAPPVNEVWFFGGFERKDGAMTAMNIVDVGPNAQRVILSKAGSSYTYDLTPQGVKPEDGQAFYSSGAVTFATEEERQATMASYLRVENPRRYVPDQLPCAGCHISTFVTAEANRKYSFDQTLFSEDRFASPGRDLTMRGGAADNPSSLRAFGYFDRDPMIAQRTINESAAVLEDLAARFSGTQAP